MATNIVNLITSLENDLADKKQQLNWVKSTASRLPVCIDRICPGAISNLERLLSELEVNIITLKQYGPAQYSERCELYSTEFDTQFNQFTDHLKATNLTGFTFADPKKETVRTLRELGILSKPPAGFAKKKGITVIITDERGKSPCQPKVN